MYTLLLYTRVEEAIRSSDFAHKSESRRFAALVFSCSSTITHKLETTKRAVAFSFLHELCDGIERLISSRRLQINGYGITGISIHYRIICSITNGIIPYRAYEYTSPNKIITTIRMRRLIKEKVIKCLAHLSLLSEDHIKIYNLQNLHWKQINKGSRGWRKETCFMEKLKKKKVI